VIPVAAAVRNAIKDAIGARFAELPITPERVRSAALQRP
jgi:CO/xanthine dehydrogenase Mo-binding subunit